MNAERAVFVYTTYPSLVEAERIGKAVLERRLAACVNILPGMISHYWWEGAIERRQRQVRGAYLEVARDMGQGGTPAAREAAAA